MTIWQCEVFADEALTLPCVTFIGKFDTPTQATEVLLHQLEAVQVSLYPGPMRETVEELFFFADAESFRMVRFAATDT